MLHLLAQCLHSVHANFGLVISKRWDVNCETQDECLGVVSYRDNLIIPVARLAQVRHHVPFQIVPERVLPLAALEAASLYFFQILATRTDEIGDV